MTAPRIIIVTSRKHVHVYSNFGRFCYHCLRPRRWWRFWETWVEEEHDEPF